MFDAPIPGMSLTHELGARPWQSPAQYPTVDKAIEYYLERMSTDEFMDQMADVLEMNVPVTTLANTIQLAGVMEGRHTIDVGMLATPVIMEMIINMAEGAGIEYSTGMERDKDAETEDSRILAGIEKAKEELETMAEADEMPEETINDVDDTTGIMSRRT